MKQLFEHIEALIPTLPGWCDVEKAQTLAALVIALRPKVTVELGVFHGRSLLAMALAHKHLGHGTVIGIDPWTNEAATEGYVGENKEWWANTNLEGIYQGFMQKVHELSVSNVVTIHRAKSDDMDVMRVTNGKTIDLLHIDGQHTEQAVRDVDKYASWIERGGIVVMDDTGWKNGEDAPVARAVEMLKGMGFASLYPLATGEVFQRTK